MTSFYEANKKIIDEYLAKFEALEEEKELTQLSEAERLEYRDAEDIKDIIVLTQKDKNRKPFIDEVIRGTQLTKERVQYILNKNGLTDEIDKSFNSVFAYKLNKKFPGAEINKEGIIPKVKVDLYYKDFNIAINIINSYENDVTRVGKKNAQMKTIQANNVGVRLINIFDYELLDEEVRARVYRMLSDILNKPLITAWARHTKVKVIDYAEARDFLNLYHIQGAATATVYLGSFYKDELVGVMTFGKPRFSKGYDYEIVRLAWKTGVRISGGTQKIFKYFVKNFEPESIMTYADINKFTGNGYLKLGYKLIQITDPDYKWVSYDSREALTRYKCQKHRLIQKGWGTIEQTEDQIMVSHGYYKVYGSGNIMLDWVKDRKVDTNVKVELNNTPTKNNSSVPKKTYNGKLSSLSNFI